ncbi:hemolysin family protein [Flavobacteriaceae bacterium]|jgi:CBS domain containing-hemolysin-like protein|nr:hemolysin family protein [Flavobacteriaceae bacterium]MDB4163861.1 hemolysin family protein [Flavobacteriaceae bacterium]MDB9794208.1 hemolysin family protein [Flavobacteriaceae bacterium]MDC1336960.1 hemolysin family protein [Flavobacteriaceae bacterium]|tara:strand:+ start:12179 stop:13444 length:1266 start_codon:yes stop_codon:yes gene_type:complete
MDNQVLVILISIIFSGFFSGMEIAFVSLNKIFLEIEKKQKGLVSFFIKKITKNSSKFIATMLLGNNIALVIYGIYSGRLIINILFPELINESSIDFKYIFYQTLISTLVILITAEFLPKVFFQIYANRLFKLFSFPAFIFYYLFSPLTFVFTWISDSVLKKYFKTKKDELRLVFSKDELGDYINQEIGNDNEQHLDPEIQIFQNALEFSKVRAREIMIPRAEIVSLDRYVNPSRLKEIFIKTGLSKILIHQENIDNIVGYISVQHMFNDYKNFKSIIISIEFVPESMFINDLLTLLTKKRKSIAVVVDEYGGTSGIITIEDIIEELVGEIEDEHDSPKFLEKKINDSHYKFSARLEIDYLNEKFKLNLPINEQYETLGGFIISLNEKIPDKGDEIFHNNLKFKIIDVSSSKIELIELVIED